jgi:signal peptide peptidase SppA
VTGAAADTTADRLLGGRVRLLQPREGYRVAIDPVLLAAAVEAKPGEHVIDLGCGVGAAALCLLARLPGLTATGLERDPATAEIARANAAANGAALEVVEGDAAAPPPLAPADWVISNPPYHDAAASDPSPQPHRAASTIGTLPLAAWLESARRLLKPRGQLAVICRADRLDALLGGLGGFGAVRLVPLWPKAGAPAKRILVLARLGRRTPCWNRGWCCTKRAAATPRRRRRCCATAADCSRIFPLGTPIRKLGAMTSLPGFLSKLPPWRKRAPTVAVLRLSGVIGQLGPLRAGLTGQSLDQSIERAFAPKRLVAVALVINSPGGSPVQSSLIHKRIREVAEKRKLPVLAFAEDVAASGGYWLALAGDEIFADENSIVGSIGVISAGFGFQDAIARLGIERRLYTAGSRKSLLDAFQPEDPEAVARLKAIQVDIHDSFKALVRARRGDRLKGDEDEIFSGEAWTGRRALELGLIDGLGDVRQVLKARWGKDVRIRPVTIQRLPWWRRLGRAEAAASLPAQALAAIEERNLWSRFGL